MQHADYYKFIEGLTTEQKRFLAKYVMLNPTRFVREVLAATQKIAPAETPEPWGTDEYLDALHPYALVKYRKPAQNGGGIGHYEFYMACGCGQPTEKIIEVAGIPCEACGKFFVANGGIGLLEIAKVAGVDDIRNLSVQNAGSMFVLIGEER